MNTNLNVENILNSMLDDVNDIKLSLYLIKKEKINYGEIK